MDVNADFAVRACVHAGDGGWVASPVAGVERLMLDRVGGEVARATSLVRFAPGSRFSPHVHGGGEEYFVLEGVFEDETGAFPAGSYVRNPPQTRHRPGSTEGCTLFVKLWQFDAADRAEVCVRTAGARFETAAGRAGVEVLPLFADARECVRLERWAAGHHVAAEAPEGLELLVLSGGFDDGAETFARHDWLRLPPGSTLAADPSPGGCVVWMKSGHLAPAAVERGLMALAGR